MPNKGKDGTYRSAVVLGSNSDGKKIKKWIRANTKREYNDKVAELKRQHKAGVSLTDVTVKEWAGTWVKTYKSNVSERQQKHYKAKLNINILPAIGDMKVRDVRKSHLMELLSSYKGRKEGTVKKIKIAVKQLFEDACTEGIIERNPAMKLALPELTQSPRRPLTDFESAVVFEAAKDHRGGPFILTKRLCGVRRGECVALLVSDVDFERKRLNVNKAFDLEKNTGHEKIRKPRLACAKSLYQTFSCLI